MFKKQRHTRYPPGETPLMVWDGNCGFCHYWIIRWRNMTGSLVDYRKYQHVAKDIPDIPTIRFKEAVRLIEPGGRIFNGPGAAYRALSYGGRWPWKMISGWYERAALFRWFSDVVYQYIASHREFMFALSRSMFGGNPRRLKYYWMGYLFVLVLLIYAVFRFL